MDILKTLIIANEFYCVVTKINLNTKLKVLHNMFNLTVQAVTHSYNKNHIYFGQNENLFHQRMRR